MKKRKPMKLVAFHRLFVAYRVLNRIVFLLNLPLILHVFAEGVHILDRQLGAVVECDGAAL